MDREWFIWSIEHKMWWKANWGGYTPRKEEAGLYTFPEACRIVREANIVGKDIPNEAMVKAQKYES